MFESCQHQPAQRVGGQARTQSAEPVAAGEKLADGVQRVTGGAGTLAHDPKTIGDPDEGRAAADRLVQVRILIAALPDTGRRADR